jgi:5-methylcytosine-specific restriction enzyme subunit McrC
MMTRVRPRSIVLGEWERKTIPYDGPGDVDSLTPAKAIELSKCSVDGKIHLSAGADGLQIETFSFVGLLQIGAVRLVIKPKIDELRLALLLRYAYGLRHLARFTDVPMPTTAFGFHDLLVSLLLSEAEELVHRGLARSYVELAGALDSPRGQLDISALIRAGGVRSSTLPCIYFERRSDNLLNQVLRAGLALGASVTTDPDLRRAALRLADRLEDVRKLVRLDTAAIAKAERSTTRLTDAYRPALTLIRLLLDSQGIDVATGNRVTARGFLFDMNTFYQRLLSRFLSENLPAHKLVDEHRLRRVFAYAPNVNPKRRRAPTPRPDFALFDREGLRIFLDAKYRDTWTLGTPAHWLYQLALYALVSPSRSSILLYATLADGATDERIDLHHPLPMDSGTATVAVVTRPVHLGRLGELLAPRNSNAFAMERRAFAAALVRHEA